MRWGYMIGDPPHDLTLLLQDWCHGDEAALDKLIPLVYAELRRLAHSTWCVNGPVTCCRRPH